MRYFIGVLMLVVGIGCSPVKPWQKGNLAKPTMAFNADPLETQFRQHVFSSREAAFGGSGVNISSCGCN
jgi:hypothetical protein